MKHCQRWDNNGRAKSHSVGVLGEQVIQVDDSEESEIDPVTDSCQIESEPELKVIATIALEDSILVTCPKLVVSFVGVQSIKPVNDFGLELCLCQVQLGCPDIFDDSYFILAWCVKLEVVRVGARPSMFLGFLVARFLLLFIAL